MDATFKKGPGCGFCNGRGWMLCQRHLSRNDPCPPCDDAGEDIDDPRYNPCPPGSDGSCRYPCPMCAAVEKAREADGNEVTLETLCRREPVWAAARIRSLEDLQRSTAECLDSTEEEAEDWKARAEKAEAENELLLRCIRGWDAMVCEMIDAVRDGKKFAIQEVLLRVSDARKALDESDVPALAKALGIEEGK